MKVIFDYLPGPVLGHKMRCEILKRALLDRGHEIVTTGARDWLIYDYPTMPTEPAMGYKRLLMGQQPYGMGDYAWHPLGDAGKRIMTGAEYIIVEPDIAKLRQSHKPLNILVTCGGSDPFELTPVLLGALRLSANCGVIIGPNFKYDVYAPPNWKSYLAPDHNTLLSIMNQYDTVVAAWGGTVFEALALGCKALPITTQPEHPQEAKKLGIAYLERTDAFANLNARISNLPRKDYNIDAMGAERTVMQMEKWTARGSV